MIFVLIISSIPASTWQRRRYPVRKLSRSTDRRIARFKLAFPFVMLRNKSRSR
ncbi:MAG: hypothetical protein F6K39_21410 [Okeania sp. SIO3B3]|nr:hypothetical protein [Okeania sp. SIO3B3]